MVLCRFNQVLRDTFHIEVTQLQKWYTNCTVEVQSYHFQSCTGNVSVVSIRYGKICSDAHVDGTETVHGIQIQF